MRVTQRTNHAPKRRGAADSGATDERVSEAMGWEHGDDDGAPSALPAEARRDTLETYRPTTLLATHSNSP